MDEEVGYRSRLQHEDFVVDKDESSMVRRQPDNEAIGVNIVGKKISGRYFDEINISLEPNSTIAIIGDNVRARDELIKIIAGEELPQNGSMTRNKNTRVEYVGATLASQNADDLANTSIQDFFFMARGIYGMEEQIYRLYEESVDSPSILDVAGDLQARFELLGGYVAPSEAQAIIEGLNIGANDHDSVSLETKLGSLSSGQASKVIIGRALFSRAEIIAMNDPTVHLDVRSKEWLANYINQSGRTIVVATSDMDFAERIATRVIEITDIGSVIQCSTDLPSFIIQRDQILEHWKDEAMLKLREIQDKRDHIKNFLGPLATKSLSLSQSKKTTETVVARLESEYEKMPGRKLIETTNIVRDCFFEVSSPSRDEVLRLSSVKLSYVPQESKSPQVINLDGIIVNRGDKLAVIGRNGSGKSTLLKAIYGLDEDLIIDGDISITSNAIIAYYSPYTSLLLDRSTTVHEALRAISNEGTSIGNIMEYWGFRRSDYHNTKISEIIHQDEIARLQMAMMMSARPNFIMLDEPTSYLTPVFRYRLVRSLEKYTGTLLVVSHDPHFLMALNLNGTLALPEGKLRREERH